MNLTQFNPVKCLAHADKIRTILKGEFSPPVLAHLDLTNRCNFKCQWCYVKSYISDQTEMPYLIAKKIINELADYKIQSILFSGGGEPTLHPDFLRIVRLAADRGLEIGLATNGSWLYKFKDRLPLENFRYIRISFDAGCEKTYVKVHQAQKGDFERTLSAAWDISLKNQCQIGMAFLATRHNYAEIPAALKWAENYDFDYFSIRPAVYKCSLSESQLRKAAKISNDLKSPSVKIYSLNDRFETLANRKKYSCRSTPLAVVVTADARLNLCCQHRGDVTYQWGDLSKETFENLWGNQRHRIILKRVKNEPCDCVCKMSHYNRIIEEVFVKDDMHLGFL